MKKLLVLLGPTASGKTAISIEIAKRFNAEIISADSMQIYRGMDIGTAKIKEDQKQGIIHHMLDILPVSEDYSVADYKDRVTEIIADIHARGKLPFLVGGTGLYLNAIVFGYNFPTQSVDMKLRDELSRGIDHLGPGLYYYHILQKCPNLQAHLQQKDKKRLLRAWEVLILTGECMMPGTVTNNPPDYDIRIIGLHTDRENLYCRIDKRVDEMVEEGLIDEVREFLLQKPGMAASQAIGYKEVRDYLRGISTYEEAVRIIKRESRKYAKRQLTWFKQFKKTEYFQVDSSEDIPKAIQDIETYLLKEGF